MRTVLVTGGAGYIGSHTVLTLLEEGYSVIVYDNLKKGHREFVLGGEFIKGDLLDRTALRNLFDTRKIDYVIHLAGDTSVPESMAKPYDYFQNNVVGGLNLVSEMLLHKVHKIVFSSTAAVYGSPSKMPITESFIPNPQNPYGESKLMFEKILFWGSEACGLEYISLRYFNVGGADLKGRIGERHFPETHLIPIILEVASGEKEVLEIYGSDYPSKDGTCIRDYIHVIDVANAHVLALHMLDKGIKNRIYNLGNNRGFSVNEIVKISQEITGKKIKIRYAARRPGDPPILVASSKKIKKELGWEPHYQDIRTIISSAWEWHKKERSGSTRSGN